MSTKSDLFSIQTAQFNGANCLEITDHDLFFRGTDEEQMANETLKAICTGCPVIALCRKDADENMDLGWRAGTSARQRRNARRNAAKKASATSTRAPRVEQLRKQGLSNVNIAKSMGISVHAIDKTVRFLKDNEAAA